MNKPITKKEAIKMFREKFRTGKMPSFVNIEWLNVEKDNIEAFISEIWDGAERATAKDILSKITLKPGKYWDNWSIERQLGYTYARQNLGELKKELEANYTKVEEGTKE